MTLRCGLWFLAFAVLACGPKDDSSEEDTTNGELSTSGDEPTTGQATGDTAEATTGEAEPAVCDCIDDEAYFETYTCDIGPCGFVLVNCDVEAGESTPGCEQEGGVFSIDEAALDCSLDRLIAGEEGAVGYDVDSNGPGRGGGVAHVLAGRQAMVRSWTFYDLGGQDTNAGIVALKDAAYFTACKAEQDLATRYACFKAWTAAEIPPTCDVESSYESI